MDPSFTHQEGKPHPYSMSRELRSICPRVRSTQSKDPKDPSMDPPLPFPLTFLPSPKGAGRSSLSPVQPPAVPAVPAVCRGVLPVVLWVSQQPGDTSRRNCSTSGCPSLLAMWKQFQPSLFLSKGLAPCSTRVRITPKFFLVHAIIRGVLEGDPGDKITWDSKSHVPPWIRVLCLRMQEILQHCSARLGIFQLLFLRAFCVFRANGTFPKGLDVP